FFFFFSSRRRHTRFSRDWSSDVCSSDLNSILSIKVRIAAIELGLIDKIEFVPATVVPGQPNDEYSRITPLKKLPVLTLDNGEIRSEERRVGKESRNRMWQDQ